ncbi:hypothetical protein [Coralliovum pocilloporae]|uniref:hypothetical protein n=1 Tax=Coralliovum pocilloporae TaxID=3066369 RepID=UPI003306A264
MSGLCLRLDPFGSSFAFRDCADLAEAFRRIFLGWPVELRRESSSDQPGVIFRQSAGQYFWETPLPGQPSGSMPALGILPAARPLKVLSDFHDDLLDWVHYCLSDQLILETSALETRHGVILLVSSPEHRSATERLCIQFARIGGRIFGTHAVRLSHHLRTASALGLQPREQTDLTGSGLSRSMAQSIARSGYQTLNERRLAGYGETRPLLGFVSLEQKQNSKASLSPGNVGRMIRLLTRQMDHRGPGPDRLVSVLSQQNSLQTATLSYTDMTEAAELLARQYGLPRQTSQPLCGWVPDERQPATSVPSLYTKPGTTLIAPGF